VLFPDRGLKRAATRALYHFQSPLSSHGLLPVVDGAGGVSSVGLVAGPDLKGSGDTNRESGPHPATFLRLVLKL